MKKKLACFAMMLLLFVATGAAQSWLNGRVAETSGGVGGSGRVTEWAKPDEEYLQFYGLEAFRTALPVVFIDTGGQRITKENKIWAELAVLSADPEGGERSILETPEKSYAMTINYRGASSYSKFDKKQYRIKFYQKAGSTKAKDCAFLGMGKNSEWVLHGPFLDKTLMRNRMAYELGREIFEWAPDSRYVEVFVDGAYQGVYLAVESVGNGESRLRLSEFGLLNGQTAYIVKRDRIGSESFPLNVYGKYAGKTNNDLYIAYPSEKKLTDSQREWITEDITAFEESLYGENFADGDIGYAQYIDMDAFVDYFVFNEILMNHDAGDLSTYAYKEINGKLKIAIWDYNNCLDNYQWFEEDYTTFFMVGSAWFSRLLQDRAFVDRAVERYHELRQTSFATEHVLALLEQFQEELGPAIDRNMAVWGYTFFNVYMSDENKYHKNAESYEEAVMLLEQSFRKRVGFLDEHIEDLYQGCIN